MKLAIWGYGHFGKMCGNLIKSRLVNDELVCYVDMDSKKWMDDMNDVVLSPTIAAMMVKQGDIEVIIIPGYENYIFREIMQKLYSLGVAYEKYVFYANYDWFFEHIEHMKRYSFSELLDAAYKKAPLVTALEIEISEKCNLNCRRCNHFSNIFDEGEDLSLDLFCSDIKKLSDVVYDIKRLKLLGGEPFLNRSIEKYIVYLRDCFPNSYIGIVTNGLLITQQEDKVWDAIRENKVVVEISVYPPLVNKLDIISNYLNDKGISYKVFRNGEKFASYINMGGNSNPNKSMMSCFAQVCHAMKKGKIYKCSAVQNIGVFNKKYGASIPESFLELDKLMVCDTPGRLLMNYLYGTIEMCKWCTGFDWHEWNNDSTRVSMDDWIAKK